MGKKVEKGESERLTRRGERTLSRPLHTKTFNQGRKKAARLTLDSDKSTWRKPEGKTDNGGGKTNRPLHSKKVTKTQITTHQHVLRAGKVWSMWGGS